MLANRTMLGRNPSPLHNSDMSSQSSSEDVELSQFHTTGVNKVKTDRMEKSTAIEGRAPEIDSDEENSPTDALLSTSERRNVASAPAAKSLASNKPAKGFRNTKVSKSALSIVIIGAVVAIGALVFGGGVIFLGRKPEAKSPPWYPSPRGGILADGRETGWDKSYRKAQLLVAKLSLPAKVNLTTGSGWSQGFCVGNNNPAYSLDGKELLFPALCLQDGPLGLRFADHATAWPAGLTTGATWNKQLMRLRGKLHGREAREKGINVILGPSMGPLGRLPAGGRNWEGFGADPFLQGSAGAETIKGIQSEGVIATAKHYIFNEQEHFRKAYEWGLKHAISSNVDDRTLHELYLWPVAEAVKAGVGSIMCSYQQSNNTYSCGNSKLLNGVLKDELGFQGFVQSDWLAEQSGVEAALAGLDMTMPGDGVSWANGVSLWGPQLTMAVLNTTVPVWRLNDMVTRIVATYYQMKQDWYFGFKHNKELNPPNFSSWTKEKIGLIYFGSGEGPKGVVNKYVDVTQKGAHANVARQIAAEGTVLVKNEGGILPLSRFGLRGKKVGIYGEDAGPGKGPNYCEDRACNQGTLGSGWGSGAVEFPYLVTPLEAIKRELQAGASGNSEETQITSVLDNYALQQVSTSASEQDRCLVFINSDSGEGYLSHLGVRGDRNDLFSQMNGDKLVLAVAEKCENTVVVIHAVGPVVVEKWIDHPNIKGLLYAHLPGQESGNALAQVLFGDVNPSGKLPYTVGKNLSDYGPNAGVLYYPNGIIPQQDFTEGLYIDYRYFDKRDIKPRYPFGFGLSYSKFTFSNAVITSVKDRSTLSELPRKRPVNLEPPNYNEEIPNTKEALFPNGFNKIKKYVYPYISDAKKVMKAAYRYPPGYDLIRSPSEAGGGQGGNPGLYEILVKISVDVKNEGPVKGKEVVQLYIGMPENVQGLDGKTVDFPVKILRGFEKVEVEKGKTKRVQLELRRKDLSYWCVYRQNWVLPKGEFAIYLGNSSRDLPIRLKW